MSVTSADSAASSCLAIFTFLWSNIAIMQLFKAYHLIFYAKQQSFIFIDIVLFLFLASALAFSTFRPHHSSSLFALSIAHISSLVLQGSQSNHVITATTISLAVLLNYSPDRDIWKKKLSGFSLALLILLYTVPGIHKMNYDWFDHRVSCASLFTSGFFSMWVPIPSNHHTLSYHFIDQFIKTAPHQAVILEVGLPLLLTLCTIAPSHISSLCFKITVFIAAVFHLMICIPLPPLSVYPFSMVMVPLYVLALPDESISYLKNLFSNFWFMGIYIAFISVLVKVMVNFALGGEKMPLEYPPYGLWAPSVVWNLVLWPCVVRAAWIAPSSQLLMQSSDKQSTSIKSTNFTKSMKLSYASIGLLTALTVIGLSPYFGVRNYPALAMFSNLRTEGPLPNHLLLPSTDIFQRQNVSVRVIRSNLASLQYLQVNLASFFAEKTKSFNREFGVENEFWITPPSWNTLSGEVAEDTTFVPYTVPLFELRRRISKAKRSSSTPFFVEYSYADESFVRVYNSTHGAGTGTDHSLRTPGLKVRSELDAPLSFWEELIFRYRSYDSSYSPCRH